MVIIGQTKAGLVRHTLMNLGNRFQSSGTNNLPWSTTGDRKLRKFNFESILKGRGKVSPKTRTPLAVNQARFKTRLLFKIGREDKSSDTNKATGEDVSTHGHSSSQP